MTLVLGDEIREEKQMRMKYEDETRVEIEDVNVLEAEEEVEEKKVFVEPEIEPLSLLGVASGCKKLNVRIGASKEEDPVCVINEGTMLVIDPAESTADWWKVYTEDGVEGFCMKQYVTVKE